MIMAKMPSQFLILPTIGLIKGDDGICFSVGWMCWVLSIYILRYITPE